MNKIAFFNKAGIALLFLLFSIHIYSQYKEGYNWYFGAYVGMTWNTTQTVGGLSGLPTPLPPSAMTNQQEGVFGMSDSDGNLLFYSDGMTIWNKNHTVMTNGSGLTGNNSSAQSGIVIPYPGQSQKYIALTIGVNSSGNLAYSVIDMSANGGLGEVTSEKNVQLTGAMGVLGESVAAVRHSNSLDYWVIAVGKGSGTNSAFNVWKVTTAGVQTTCFASYTLPQSTNASAGANGYLRFTADGKSFAWPEHNSQALYFGTFDPSTGTFPTIKVMNAGYIGYGAEFSSSGSILYIGAYSHASINNINAYKFEDLLTSSNPASVAYRSEPVSVLYGTPLQLGPDGRIYGAIFGATSMAVIDDVNDYDNFTVYTIDGLLPTGTNYQGRLGLPNYMAYFFTPVKNTCSYFTDDIWYFGIGGGGIAFNENNSGDKVAVSASGESKVASAENSLSVSSPGCGSSLIFYSQHNQLYNAKHEPMLNGSFSGHTSVADGLAACYIGNNQYMLFAVNNAYETSSDASPIGLDYHIIDMSGDDGYGEKIASGNIEPSGMAESIELLPVPNTSDQYWLIYRLRAASIMRVRKITGATISAPTDFSLSSYEAANAATYSLRANKEYNMLALLYTGVNVAPVVLFNFDTSTGVLSYKDKINPPLLGGSTYGLEISPNSKYVYVTAYDNATSMISQYDIQNKIWTTPFQYGGRGGGMKVGPDGKLYVKRPGQYMGVIDNPDAPLTVAGYAQNGFDLGNGINSTGLAFSTGLTPPAICPSGLNQAPVAIDDTSTVFVNGSSTCIPVMANDYDPNPGDSISLVNVYFLNEADTSILDVSFNLGDSVICVTPKSAAQEGDVVTLIYTIRDNANPIRLCADAKVTITVIKYPDNIVDADCYVTRDSTEWAIKRGWSSEPIVSYLNIPLVGDLDNDSIPDILCFGTVGSAGVGSYGSALKRMLIYDGQSHILKKTIDLPSYVSGWDAAGYGLVKLPDKTGLIVVACWDTYLRAYDITKPNGSELVWTSDTRFGTVGNDFAVNIGFADFNNDGYPEIYVRNKIYDAETGKLLATATGGTNTGSSWAHYSHATLRMLSSPFAADIIGDSRLELLLGNEIYDVNIVSRTNPSLNSINRIKTITPPSGTPVDGHVQVADFNNDGYLDILITNRNTLGISGMVSVYIWDVHNNKINANPLQITTNFSGKSIPLIGDINNDGALDILIQCGVDITDYTYGNKAFRAYTYNTSTETFDLLWYLSPHEDSYSNSATLFDFNLNGKKELLISDQMNISIYDCNGNPPVLLNSFPFGAVTIMQYPVIVDVDNDGSAEIVAVAGGYLHILESDATPWAPARKVWNQYNYNAVNVNEDLTIPKFPANPATVFPGDDGVLGTTKDVRPYNAFLQQQTMLDKNGIPLWLTPDIYPDQSLTSHSITGDSVSITIGMINKGDAAIGKPVYVSLYKESISPANKMVTDSANIQILPGDTGYVTARIPNIMLYLPMVSIIARVNDDGKYFPYQLECDDTNNIITIINPVLNRMMQKDATLDNIPHNGTYDNPVSALFSETIEYTITAVNANTGTGRVIIRDTLPSYLNFISSNPVIVPTAAGTTPQRNALEWNIPGVASMATTIVTVKATPHPGCSSSQPMFINRAWVTVSDTITVPTNYTYHQGACVGMATFSAGFGGNIYNAAEQALDYRTTPRSGIVIVPDEGYRFAGWSHDEYISLRGNTINAEEGIMHYDTLTVYGNIELQANFELEEYPIGYYLNGSENAGNNPPAYTIESGSITLGAPEKAGDVFTGWTGSNGEKPQLEVIIPNGSTGELEFYANFLRSGREEETRSQNPEEDRIWAAKDELYIRTSKTGSIVRVYSTEGVLQKQQTIRQAGETKMKLQRGIYVVTLDNGIGQIVRIE
ncbi:MAG: FG-GAP-like repeat-containing protein [Tannerella sp.]|jgi:uncharacterized repeat protein (TIGR02543 family)|nr:FG-GAP-like repeat-containing protein [Tannerella sp.]